MTSKDRLLLFLKHKSIGQTVFEKTAGISNGYINNNKGSIGSTILSKISKAFPDLNIDWISTGNGEMIKSLNEEANQISDIQFMNIPFVPIYAQAGYGKGYGDQEYIDNLPTMPVIVDKTYKGKYRVFEVKGDSMDDGSRKSLCEGDKILCREVRPDLWQNKLHIKDWFFVICMKDNGILVKQILSHEVETGDIICHSLNSSFGDFKMNLSEVGELYNVIKIVDRNTRI
jgi:hypothetical protein